MTYYYDKDNMTDVERMDYIQTTHVYTRTNFFKGCKVITRNMSESM